MIQKTGNEIARFFFTLRKDRRCYGIVLPHTI